MTEKTIDLCDYPLKESDFRCTFTQTIYDSDDPFFSLRYENCPFSFAISTILFDSVHPNGFTEYYGIEPEIKTNL